MENVQRNYLPPAGRAWLLPIYDPLVKLAGVEPTRKILLELADMQAARRILDVGCGTGTLATLAKQLYPQAAVTGIDPDAGALARGRRKAARARVAIRFDQGFADALPYPDSSFDRVFSSLMFHHVSAEQKVAMLREIRRVLTAEGTFYLVDFLRPENGAKGILAHRMHSNSHLLDNSEARILTLLHQAGFSQAEMVLTSTALFGRVQIGYFRAAIQAAAPL